MVTQPTARRHHTVVATTVMTLIADSAELTVGAELHYSSRDPFAVRVLFAIPNSPSVEWVFSRDLLANGICGPAGAGDVQVFPTADGVVLELDSPGGRARLLTDRQPLIGFVQDMLSAVPPGHEGRYFDIDDEIAMLVRADRLPGPAQI